MSINYRKDFPILQRVFSGHSLVYLDSAATTQKPQCVIDAVSRYYEHDNANVHRGIYTLSVEATAAYEAARTMLRLFIGAAEDAEVIFTRGTTESINLVAFSYGERFVKEGDEILVTTMEHHSNIVPWQMLCARKGAYLKVIPVSDDGVIDLDIYRSMLSAKVKMVAAVHVSNVLGTVNPIQEMIAMAHEFDIPVLVDGAQALPHLPVDVQALDCDFYAFSSHKMYGSTGVGGLYGKRRWLDAMPPYQGGGDMIHRVSFEQTDYSEIPSKFEAGTPNTAGVAGFAAAIAYINAIGFDFISSHEKELRLYAQMKLSEIPGLVLVGSATHRISAISFTLAGAHPHDVSTILNEDAIAVRAGHHCAMPLMHRLKLSATVRISFGIYNNKSDVDRLCEALMKVRTFFKGEK